MSVSISAVGEILVTHDHSSAPPDTPDLTAPRFHPAHPASVPRAPTTAPHDPAELLAVVGREPIHAQEQLQLQAAELSEHLRQRQYHLTRWEASLNARAAQQDDERRTARLWLREQQLELTDRESELQHQAAQLEARTAELESLGITAQALARQQAQLEQQEHLLADQRQLLELELENTRRQSDWLNTERDNWQQQSRQQLQACEQLREQLLAEKHTTQQLGASLRAQLAQHQQQADESAQLHALRQDLSAQETLLRQEYEQLTNDKLQWAREKRAWQDRTIRQRQTLAKRWRQRRQSLQAQLEALQARRRANHEHHEQLLQRQEQLDQLQRQLHTDRFLLQQVQSQLENRSRQTDLTPLIQAVRQFVEAESAEAQEKLCQHRTELQQLAQNLERQRESLETRHARLHTSMLHRQAELDALASDLLRREQRLAEVNDHHVESSAVG